MEFTKIKTILKRYSFEEKMNISQWYSRKIIKQTWIKSGRGILPWEIETFVLLSIIAEEWKKDKFNKINDIYKDENFMSIMKSIRESVYFKLDDSDVFSFADLAMVSLAATQFHEEENPILLLYRHNYYFNFKNEIIDMKEVFKEKFNVEYEEIANFMFFLWSLYFMENISSEQIDKIINSNEISNMFVINRDDYINSLNETTSSLEDFIYCLRPSYNYAFIQENNKLYCPLPHLLIKNITLSLLLRLTDNDDNLRSIIGKEVFESYLVKILLENEQFDEVIPEREYGKNSKTSDVMCRIKDLVVFFESKSYMPPINMRLCDENDLEKGIDRISKAIVQIYNQLRKEFQKKYYFFNTKIDFIEEKLFGLVVLQENPYISLEMIYNEAAKKLEIEIGSTEYGWICKHIGVVSISDIEKFSFSDTKLISEILRRKENGCQFDHWLTGVHSNTKKNKYYGEFLNSLEEKLKVSYDKYDLENRKIYKT